MYKSPITLMIEEIARDHMKKMDEWAMTTIKQRLNLEIDADELIKALNYDRQQYDKGFADGYNHAKGKIKARLYNVHEVACIIADLFGDPCACNFNGIDEWLPQLCDFREKECPNVIGVACWEQYLKHRYNKEVDK